MGRAHGQEEEDTPGLALPGLRPGHAPRTLVPISLHLSFPVPHQCRWLTHPVPEPRPLPSHRPHTVCVTDPFFFPCPLVWLTALPTRSPAATLGAVLVPLPSLCCGPSNSSSAPLKPGALVTPGLGAKSRTFSLPPRFTPPIHCPQGRATELLRALVRFTARPFLTHGRAPAHLPSRTDLLTCTDLTLNALPLLLVPHDEFGFSVKPQPEASPKHSIAASSVHRVERWPLRPGPAAPSVSPSNPTPGLFIFIDWSGRVMGRDRRLKFLSPIDKNQTKQKQTLKVPEVGQLDGSGG